MNIEIYSLTKKISLMQLCTQTADKVNLAEYIDEEIGSALENS